MRESLHWFPINTSIDQLQFHQKSNYDLSMSILFVALKVSTQILHRKLSPSTQKPTKLILQVGGERFHGLFSYWKKTVSFLFSKRNSLRSSPLSPADGGGQPCGRRTQQPWASPSTGHACHQPHNLVGHQGGGTSWQVMLNFSREHFDLDQAWKENTLK